MSENDAILKVNGLKTYFYQASGVSKAVDGVSFTLKEGTTMGIVGESGSGKSVTSASVMRLMPAKTGKIVDGSIIFDGVDIRSLSESQMEKFRGDELLRSGIQDRPPDGRDDPRTRKDQQKGRLEQSR